MKNKMTQKDYDVWTLISSVLNDSASLEEKKQVDAWINQSEENRKTYEILLKIGLKKEKVSQDFKYNVYSKFHAGKITSSYFRNLRFWKYSAVASFATILILGSILTIKKIGFSDLSTDIETFCPYGIKSKVDLPDGTVVHLNSGSSIHYPAQFKGDYREVTLTGEGYFEVQKDLKHPFIVQTGDINIRVFGTHFNVKNYQDDEVIQTTLIEGSVGIYKDIDKKIHNLIKLVPNQKAIYNKESGLIVKRNVDADLSAVWTEGKYYFEKESFQSIVKQLERNYNMNIKVLSKALNEKVYTGLIDKNMTIFQTLDIMKRYSHFDYFMNNDTIVINDK